jgi:tRNA pseudouridine38-40 synthase
MPLSLVMPRYFLEVAYDGKSYSGFQVQANANSVQEEVEKAISIFLRQPLSLTGASRTDTGVHARQNYFHFDFQGDMPSETLYHLNAILPQDIVLKSVKPVRANAHCRFDAISRHYSYHIYASKDPFLRNIAFFFPFALDRDVLRQAAAIIPGYSDFSAFSKRNSQVKDYLCSVSRSVWLEENGLLVFHIESNRFLRGMVRGLVGTMLLVGRLKMGLNEFASVIAGADPRHADFSVPGHGLFLEGIQYPDSVFVSV